MNDMSSPTFIAGFFDPIWSGGFIFWWQIPLLLGLIGLLIFWKRYRNRMR
jgi:hypothetical protein